MASRADQLVLDLPLRPALGAEDFIVSASNAEAVKMIDRWPHWPAPALILCGPAGSGKTHLGHVWRMVSAARLIKAAGLTEELALELAAGRGALVESVDTELGSETALFHLLNLAKEQGFHVLITARKLPGKWRIALPDLRSRVRSFPVAEIGLPDENLLRAVLVKLLGDRQLPATPHGVNHLVRHMDRSMEMALLLVEEIDRMLWTQPGPVTRSVAAKALARVRHQDTE